MNILFRFIACIARFICINICIAQKPCKILENSTSNFNEEVQQIGDNNDNGSLKRTCGLGLGGIPSFGGFECGGAKNVEEGGGRLVAF